MLMWDALSGEKSGLQFSVFAGEQPAQPFSDLSHGTRQHILLFLFLRLPKTCIYLPQEQGSPGQPLGNGCEISASF
jgi:hypothetical protein